MTEAELIADRAQLKATYDAVQIAIIAVVGGAQEFILDTGQTRRNVTKANLEEMTELMKWLRDEIARIDGELGLGNTVGKQIYARPGF